MDLRSHATLYPIERLSRCDSTLVINTSVPTSAYSFLHLTMGTAASRTPVELTEEQKDCQLLAEQFPFGDAEIKHLYRAYDEIRTCSTRTTFLQDWGYHTVSDEAKRDERKLLLQIIEEKILTISEGQKLYETAFLVPGDTNMYRDESATKVSDEFTRTQRIKQVFEGFTNAGRKGSKQAVQVMFDMCQQCQESRVRSREFVQLGYRLALAVAFLQAAEKDDENMSEYLPVDDRDQKMLEAFAASIVERGRLRRQRNILTGESTDDALLDEGWVQIDDIQEWAEGIAPVFGSTLPTFIHYLLFPGQPYPPSRTPFDFPKVPLESTFFSSASSSLLFTLGCLSSSLSGTYYRLYTSASDGLSFNRLMNALLGYSGPTLLIVQATNGGVFGAFTASPWKESKDFYGNSDVFLFQMSPCTAIYRPTGNARNFMYCNSYARSRGYDQQCHGIGFGGTVDEPRFFIDESFDACVAGSQDLTFENGLLLPPTPGGGAQKHFEIDRLEVWGVGGDQVVRQALGARAKAREIKDEGIRRARKVDKAQFLDDFRSGAISSKAFAHRQQIDGRADADVEERVKPKYDYE